ncbi:mitochondrial ribosomal subunit S27-domain-containing protein, partial [Vararia minispora EC-137]
PARIRHLAHLRAQLFQTAWNPLSLRTGAKYLRRRLVGPAMVDYYPQRWNMAMVNRLLPAGIEWPDREEEQRLWDIEYRKSRGKGTPKKAKSERPS